VCGCGLGSPIAALCLCDTMDCDADAGNAAQQAASAALHRLQECRAAADRASKQQRSATQVSRHARFAASLCGKSVIISLADAGGGVLPWCMLRRCGCCMPASGTLCCGGCVTGSVQSTVGPYHRAGATVGEAKCYHCEAAGVAVVDGGLSVVALLTA